jgi:hypothetical protein
VGTWGRCESAGENRHGAGGEAVVRAKSSTEKGLAIRSGPELCVDDQRWRGEALAGVRIGAVLSSEITVWECRPCTTVGKAICGGAIGRVPVQLPGVRDLQHVRTLHVREPGDLGRGCCIVPKTVRPGKGKAAIPACTLPRSRTGP